MMYYMTDNMKKIGAGIVMGTVLFLGYNHWKYRPEDKAAFQQPISDIEETENSQGLEAITKGSQDVIIDTAVYGIYKYPAEVYSRCVKKGIIKSKELFWKYSRNIHDAEEDRR